MTKISVDGMKLINKPGNNVRAVCDLILRVDETSALRLCGYRVIESDSGSLWVSTPARHGAQRWFDVIAASGPLRKEIHTAVLEAYERAGKIQGAK